MRYLVRFFFAFFWPFGESLFLRKLISGIPAPIDGKNYLYPSEYRTTISCDDFNLSRSNKGIRISLRNVLAQSRNALSFSLQAPKKRPALWLSVTKNTLHCVPLPKFSAEILKLVEGLQFFRDKMTIAEKRKTLQSLASIPIRVCHFRIVQLPEFSLTHRLGQNDGVAAKNIDTATLRSSTMKKFAIASLIAWPVTASPPFNSGNSTRT